MSITPQQAADKAGVSRPTIMLAIKSGSLVARRANSGNKWQIEEEALERWMRDRVPLERLKGSHKAEAYTEDRPSPTVNDEPPTPDNSAKIRALEGEVEALQARLAASRDELAREQGRGAEKDATIALLRDLIRDQQSAPEAPQKRGWWPWSRS